MTEEFEQLFDSTFLLRKQLSQVLSKEAVDYIIKLVVLDQAHKKYLKLSSENEEDLKNTNNMQA
jgi:hypothetical protein